MRLAILAIVALVAINAERSSAELAHVSVEEDLLTPIDEIQMPAVIDPQPDSTKPATEMAMTQFSGGQWTHRAFHWARKGNCLCTKYRRPVCVNKYLTFFNACRAKCAGHHKFKKGTCKAIKKAHKKAKAKAKERKKKAKKAKKEKKVKKWIAHHHRHHLIGHYHHKAIKALTAYRKHAKHHGRKKAPTFGTMVMAGYDGDDAGADGDDGLGY